MTMPLIINNDNFEEAKDAIREILMPCVMLADRVGSRATWMRKDGSIVCASSTRSAIPGAIGATWSC